MNRDLWILTTAPGSRTQEVNDLFSSLSAMTTRNLVVTNLPEPVSPWTVSEADVICYPGTDFNISLWWDYGLQYIRSQYSAEDEWDVLLIESDARIPQVDLLTLRLAMRDNQCVMAGADWQDCLKPYDVKVRRDNSEWVAPGREAWQSRLPGMALLVAGEAGLDHEPLQPRFWFSDDHLEWKAREAGGTVLVGGTTIHHNGTQGPLKGDLLKWAEEDKVRFKEYWGGLPEDGGIPNA